MILIHFHMNCVCFISEYFLITSIYIFLMLSFRSVSPNWGDFSLFTKVSPCKKFLNFSITFSPLSAPSIQFLSALFLIFFLVHYHYLYKYLKLPLSHSLLAPSLQLFSDCHSAIHLFPVCTEYLGVAEEKSLKWANSSGSRICSRC